MSGPAVMREPLPALSLFQLLVLGLAEQVAAEKFKAIKCLSLVIDVTESLPFSRFRLARVMSPGGVIFSGCHQQHLFRLSPFSQHLAAVVAARMLHPAWCTSVLGCGCISHHAVCWV